MYQWAEVTDSIAFFLMQFLYRPITKQQSGQAQRFPLSSSCNFLARQSPFVTDKAAASKLLLPASTVPLPSAACNLSCAVLAGLSAPLLHPSCTSAPMCRSADN